MDVKPLLRSLVPDQLAGLIAKAGLPSYRGDQLADWLFARGVFSWEEMTNLPQALREDLAERFDLSGLETEERQVSDDGTRKFLFRLRDGTTVESVIIPMDEHVTFCISTQVGCAMACRFCATARGGLVRNLESGEILEQVLRLRADLADNPIDGLGKRQFNVVYMGMGEPLDNWDAVADSLTGMMDPKGLAMSRRRIQISTSGRRQHGRRAQDGDACAGSHFNWRGPGSGGAICPSHRSPGHGGLGVDRRPNRRPGPGRQTGPAAAGQTPQGQPHPPEPAG